MDFVKQHEELFITRLMRSSKTSIGKRDSGKQLQLPGIYLSALSRSGLRLNREIDNIPDMASSHRPSQTKLQPRTPRDRHG